MASVRGMGVAVITRMCGGCLFFPQSFEHYDRRTGISVYAAPSVKPGAFFTYFDPLTSLDPAIQAEWQDPRKAEAMIAEAIQAARATS